MRSHVSILCRFITTVVEPLTTIANWKLQIDRSHTNLSKNVLYFRQLRVGRRVWIKQAKPKNSVTLLCIL